jgi:N-carbamoylputrescine amidase
MYHNTVAVIDADGQYLGMYRKMHIPDDPRYYEKFYFTPGDLGFKNFDTKYGRIGVLICWDQWFPEAARLTAMQGANVLFYPTAIGWHPAEKAEYGDTQRNAWQGIQRGHAIANGIYTASPNRTGVEHGNDGGAIEFFGNSFICDPSGNFLQQTDEKFEGVLTALVDPQKLETTRQHWPFFRDRRIEHYGKLTQHPD